MIRKRGEEEKRLYADSCVCIVGWGNTPTEASFGGGGNDAASVKGKLVNLISSVRTLMRSEFAGFFFPDLLRRGVFSFMGWGDGFG